MFGDSSDCYDGASVKDRPILEHTDSATSIQANAPSVEQCEDQVRRVLRSTTFRNATTLQQLLGFLAFRSIAGAAENLKEYTIGVEALGRKSDFDPKIDPIVRVQSHRLRVKLKEYYEVEGRHDPILILIPKGHYLPTFEVVSSTQTRAESIGSEIVASDPLLADGDGRRHQQTASPRSVERNQGVAKRWTRPQAIFLAAMLAVFALAGYWLGRLRSNGPSESDFTTASAWPSNERKPHDSAELFWWKFLDNDVSPVIGYPDAVFLLDDSNDLFRFRHGASDNRGAVVDPHLARQFASNSKLVGMAGPLYYENGYTGTGELESIAMLSGLLNRIGAKPIIKASRDITPDDLDRHNVILLGSPFQNVAVAQLLTVGDFSFRNPDERHEQWRGQIIDTHPAVGSKAIYTTERDVSTRMLTTDYSLVTITAGVTPGRHIAFLGGLDTKGTQGATMFATSVSGIEEIEKALAAPASTNHENPTPFQALVRVKLAKGYQVLGAELVAVRPLLPSNASQVKDNSTPLSH
ncbi:hypothetical protein EDE15_4645 [Edaphobacter aggregans]|uniref:Uncharacterized protein n=1 Tax=Edaphobacter aggregans TaxID=570835 RepID=A0A428MQ52_9BACT|nr:hypothetical protein EDE15_4645 [Edaphobacter aggregans]